LLKHKDYERIASAIEYIRANVSNQPTLADVATHVHLSEFHFQRLFSRWAGVTPKRYLQVLTLEKAKVLLRDKSLSTLDTSYEVGLTSGSRLYDHFVQIEAVTPSEYRTKGEGIEIMYGYHFTPYGLVFLAQTARGICQLDLVDLDNDNGPLEHLKKQWGNAVIYEDRVQTEQVIKSVFCVNHQKKEPLSLWLRGTNFQLSVWRALLNLRQSEIASYSDIAAMIGKPKASRAVGTAIGANPVALVIPCHRVLKQNGELGGYRWGEVRKHTILAREFAYGE